MNGRMAVAPQSPWIVEAEGLGRTFKKSKALSGIDLQLPRGEIFGIVGPDGAGKTTLMQLLAAILDPTEGRCRVLGFDTVAEAASIASRIGYMSQGFTLYERLSVDENLAFAARIRGIHGEPWRLRRQQLLAMAGLERFTDRPERQLSGGMRKKLALCTNLIHEPPLLLLDEPSLGVDPLSRRELWAMLRSFRKKGTTIVLATSYMDEARFCDRLAFLESGKLLALGTPAELEDGMAGCVFEIATNRPSEVEAKITSHPEVIGFQRLPRGVRFQTQPSAHRPQNLTAELSPWGAVQSAAPSLEDAFTLLAATGSPLDQPLKSVAVTVAPAARRPADAGVEVRGLTCRFGDFVAVDNVTLDVAPGEVFGFLGPNGAGKTTLIRALCGLVRPTEGSARVAGVEIPGDGMRLRGQIGYMSQRFSLYPDLTVAENLFFFAGAYGLNGRRRRLAIGTVMALTGLGGLEERRVREISGALRQRLALACSILHEPLVLFLDEPTSGVDPPSRHRFWRLILALASSGKTVFVTTHNLEEAAYCHRLGLMHQGRLIASGDLELLRTGVGADPKATVEDVFLAYIDRARDSAADAIPEIRP